MTSSKQVGSIFTSCPMNGIRHRGRPQKFTLSYSDGVELGKPVAKKRLPVPPQPAGESIREKIMAALQVKESTMADLLREAGKGHVPSSVQQALKRLIDQGHVRSETVLGEVIYSADPDAKVLSQAQKAHAQRLVTWIELLRILAKTAPPAPTASAIAALHGRCVKTVREHLRNMAKDKLVQMHTVSVNVAALYTITPIGLAFLEGSEK